MSQDTLVEDFEVNGLTVEIHYDTDPESPRDWGNGNLGKMCCWNSRHSLGDENPHKSPDDFMRQLFSDAEFTDSEIKEVLLQAIKDKHWREDYRNCFLSNKDYESKTRCREIFFCEKLIDNWDWIDAETKSVLWRIIDDHVVIMSLFLYDHSGISMSVNRFTCPWDSGQVGWIYCTKQTVIDEYGTWSAETVEKTQNQLTQEVETYSEFIEGRVYGYRVIDGEGEDLDSCWGIFGNDYCKLEATETAKYLAVEIEAERVAQRLADVY